MSTIPKFQIGNNVRIMDTLSMRTSAQAEYVNRRGVIMSISHETPNIEAHARVLLGAIVVPIPLACLMRLPNPITD